MSSPCRFQISPQHDTTRNILEYGIYMIEAELNESCCYPKHSCSSWKLQAFLHKDFDFDLIIPLLPDTCP